MQPHGRVCAQRVCAAAAAEDASLDTGGILWLEHINIVVSSRTHALAFYRDLCVPAHPASARACVGRYVVWLRRIGFTEDPEKRRPESFHLNLGWQQLHLAEGSRAQIITGSLGLAVPSLGTVRQRLAAAHAALAGSAFSADDLDDHLRLTCPDGSVVCVYAAAPLPTRDPSRAKRPRGESEADGAAAAENTRENLPRLVLAQRGYDAGMAVRGGPGIRYLELRAPRGAARKIGSFYASQLGAVVAYPAGHVAVVTVGPAAHLIFDEQGHDGVPLEPAAAAAMEGLHVAIYILNFRDAYVRLRERSLIWINPRFRDLDTCDAWEEAAASRQFRFRHIPCAGESEPGCWDGTAPTAGTESGTERPAKYFELEHETRAVRHFQFFKRVEYVPA